MRIKDLINGDLKMCIMLNMEDLVANALIELLENKSSRKVSFNQLESYKNNIIQMFKEQKKDVVVSISDDNTDRLLSMYSNFFYIRETTNEKYIYLKEEKNEYDLRRNFRSYLPLDMIKIFYNENVLQPLLK